MEWTEWKAWIAWKAYLRYVFLSASGQEVDNNPHLGDHFKMKDVHALHQT